MCDADCHRPAPDPYVGPVPNDRDIFWWEFKAQKYSAMISSLSHWSEISDHFPGERVVISLEDCQFPVNETVYGLFHNSAILDKGSWARVNATLRQLFRSSLGITEGGTSSAGALLPIAVKLGMGPSFSFVSSFVTWRSHRYTHNYIVRWEKGSRLGA